MNAPLSKRFANLKDVQRSRQRLEYGGFSTAFARTNIIPWFAGTSRVGKVKSAIQKKTPLVLTSGGKCHIFLS